MYGAARIPILPIMTQSPKHAPLIKVGNISVVNR